MTACRGTETSNSLLQPYFPLPCFGWCRNVAIGYLTTNCSAYANHCLPETCSRPKHWGRLVFDPKTKTLLREGIPNIINPLDKKALEAALQLVREGGGEVIALSMAPPSTLTPVLREGFAMGARPVRPAVGS